MKTFPKPLSTKEEQLYLWKHKNGDKSAREILILRNLRLVAHIVKKYTVNENDIEDMISIGTIGLIKAIDTFQLNKNIKLATYAARCIENEILMLLRNEKKLAKEVHINEVIKTDNTGNAISLMDIIETFDDDVIDKMYINENIIKMYVYMDKVLSEREKEIIYLRYGLNGNDELTQREIAKKMNISRSYVSRIEKKALLKLREKIML